MEVEGSRTLAVTQQQAWDALNDPEVLKACIPGCDSITADGEGRYAIGMQVKVGPVSAKFSGKIALSDVNPPNGYTLAFEGQGGAAGFGKGTAQVRLAPPPEGAGCALHYHCSAQVGGRIAQVGQRLIDGVAKSMAEDFFKRFDAQMQERHPQAYAVAAAPVAGSPTAGAKGPTIPAWIWIAGVAAVLAAAWLWLGR